MSDPGDSSYFPTEYSPSVATEDMFRQPPAASSDPTVPLLNLSAVRSRMDSLQQFLSDSVNGNTILAEDQMATVSSELVSAIHQVIVNGAALLASSQIPNLPPHVFPSENLSLFSTNFSDANIVADEIAEHPKMEANYGDLEGEIEIDEYEVVELDAVELLAEHMHFCDICGKGFKRDANLRMHMRAHGDQFKTAEALAKPENFPEPPQMSRRTRFSCPFVGCNRNKQHKKFRPLKSVICVKNHFKRSHCPKMYSCNRCNKKKFSVLADLKSHMKHCGESKWRCSCGTSFSRKDKLFGHMALFEGHRPAIVVDDDKSKGGAALEEDENQPLAKEVAQPEAVLGCSGLDNGFFDGLLDGFGSIENFCLQEMLEASPDLNSGIEGLYNF